MLDVHPPHEKMHGVRDFLLHLFTITIGLFIALLLEGCVERSHQHHMRDEADQNIRLEIQDNLHDLGETRAAVASEQKSLIFMLNYLQARSQNQPSSIKGQSLSMTSSTLSDASWRTATATGALTFMDYRRAQQFASSYQLQDLFTRIQMETMDSYLQLQSYVAYGFDPDKFPPDQAKSALPTVRDTISHLTAMDQIAATLETKYKETLSQTP